jgi:hypothetical protein
MLNTLKQAARNLAKEGLSLATKLAGAELLSPAQTETFLAPYELAQAPAHIITLNVVPNAADPGKTLFTHSESIIPANHVWAYRSENKPVKLLRHGAILTNGKVLHTDFGNVDFLRDLPKPDRRPVRQVDTLIAPFTHYQDGIKFGGYYDFVLLVAAKLARIKAVLPTKIFAEAIVAYPLFHTDYECEWLALLGLRPEQILDSRQTQVQAKTAILSNNSHWFYPHPEAIGALRQQVEIALPKQPTGRKRLYISRSGRRKIVNETELIALLKTYDFEIVADQPRTVAEQVALYRSASFIVGPHGASFTNLLWCQPGTQLVELFSPNYTPDFFRYLADLLELRYAAYAPGPARPNPDSMQTISEAITVSVPDLEPSLNKLLLS